MEYFSDSRSDARDEPQAPQQSIRFRDALAGDVHRAAVARAGQQHLAADRHGAGGLRRQQLDRDVALVVQHRHVEVVFAVGQQRVGALRTVGGDAQFMAKVSPPKNSCRSVCCSSQAKNSVKVIFCNGSFVLEQQCVSHFFQRNSTRHHVIARTTNRDWRSSGPLPPLETSSTY